MARTNPTGMDRTGMDRTGMDRTGMDRTGLLAVVLVALSALPGCYESNVCGEPESCNLFDDDYIATVSVLNIASPNSAVLYPGSPLSAFVGLRFSY